MYQQALSNFAIVLLLLMVFIVALRVTDTTRNSIDKVAPVEETPMANEVVRLQFKPTIPREVLVDDASQNCIDFESFDLEARSMWGGGLQRRNAPKATQLRSNLVQDLGAHSSLFIGTIFDEETLAQNVQEIQRQLMRQPAALHKDLAFGIKKSNVAHFMRTDLPDRLKEAIDELDNARFADQAAKLREVYSHVQSDMRHEAWLEENNRPIYFAAGR